MFFWCLFFIIAPLCGVSARSVPSGYVERTVTRPDGTNATAYLREDFVPTTDHQFSQVQARQLHKHFFADFHSTQDHQYMCAFQSDYCNTDFDSPVVSDCETLMDVLLETPGYWELGDWTEGAFEPLTFLETCIVAVARTDDHFRDNARFVPPPRRIPSKTSESRLMVHNRVGDGDAYAWLMRTTQRCSTEFVGVKRAGSVGTYMCPGEDTRAQARIIAWITAKIQ